MDTIRIFVEGNGLYEALEVLSAVEMGAAKSAFAKSRIAVDKKQQVWQAIGHLETAVEALDRTYRSKTQKIIRFSRWEEARLFTNIPNV